MNVAAGVPETVCGAHTRLICEWVYQHTGGNAVLARLADWLIGRPLAVLGVLVVGALLRWIIRRRVARSVTRVLVRLPLTSAPDTGTRSTSTVPSREQARRTTRAHAVAAAVSSTLSTIVWILSLIVVVAIIGIDVGPIIASAGLAGVALAFGAQSLIRDLLSGTFILIEDHFGLGDEVDLGEAVGVVEKMTLRETVLRDLDGTVWHMPNGGIERVGNHSQVWSAAMIDVGVAHGTDLGAARTALCEAAGAVIATPPFHGEVLEPPEVLGVQSLAPEGITLRLRVKTLAGRQFQLERAIREAIELAFRIHGVELASPTMTIRMRSANGRTRQSEFPSPG